MKFPAPLFSILILCSTFVNSGIAQMTDAEAELEGQRLARFMRDFVPEIKEEFKTEMQIRRDEWVTVPVKTVIQPGVTTWTNTFEANFDDRTERLDIVRRPGNLNRYFYTKVESGKAEEPKLIKDPMTPFAGSDFLIGELGLDFLYWPSQKLIIHRIKIRKTRDCYVLESTRPASEDGGYVKVVSWIDKEALAPIFVQARDEDDKLIKEFEVESVTKVDGVWQIGEIKMLNNISRSRTTIEYQYDKD